MLVICFTYSSVLVLIPNLLIYSSSLFLPYAVLSCSVMSDSATPWTAAHQAPLFMGILQTRILEWVAMPSSRRSSQSRDQTQVSHIAGGFFTNSGSPRILMRVAYPFSRGSSWPKIKSGSLALQADSLPAELLGVFFSMPVSLYFVNKFICMFFFLYFTCKWYPMILVFGYIAAKWHYFIPFYGQVIFQCIYMYCVFFIHSSMAI